MNCFVDFYTNSFDTCGRYMKQVLYKFLLHCITVNVIFFYTNLCLCTHRLELVHLVLFNLMFKYRKSYYDLDCEILPWVKDHWGALQTGTVCRPFTLYQHFTTVAFWSDGEGLYRYLEGLLIKKSIIHVLLIKLHFIK